MSKTATYLGGYWSTNIGNAFYNLGVTYVLGKLLGNENISFFQDNILYAPPQYVKNKKLFYRIKNRITRNLNISKVPKHNWDNIYHYIKTDYLFLSGPLFNEGFSEMWLECLTELSKKHKLIFISAGGSTYNEKEKDSVRCALQKLKPYALITRDSHAYQAYADLFQHAYDGICFAFFTSDYYRDNNKTFENSIALTFEPGKSPDNLQLNKWLNYADVNKNKIGSVNPSNKNILLSDYSLFHAAHSYTDYLMSRRPPKTFDIIGDTPELYLRLYKDACVTFSDRVHACVPSIAFGNSAMLFSKSKRAKLFDRVGLADIHKRPVSINQTYLTEEKNKLIYFLDGIL